MDSLFEPTTEAVLEDYLLQEDIAEEGFLFTSTVEENMDILSQKDTALIVLTSDANLFLGGVSKRYMSQIVNKYGFNGYCTIDILEYLLYRLNKGSLDNKFDIKCDEGPLLAQLEKHSFNSDDFMSVSFLKILDTLDAYTATSGKLVVAINGHVRSYTYSYMRNRPLLITDASLVSTFFKSVMNDKSIFKAINYSKTQNAIFETMNDKIPPKLIMFGKDLKYPLWHISPNGNIKRLEPRVTSKPMNGENIRISRVSAAPTIDACFKAIGLSCAIKEKNDVKRYYVYKLKITPQMKIVKPTTKIVPDVWNTSEHWILQEVEVDNYGYIDVSLNADKTYNFNSEKCQIDPMISSF